MEFDKCSHEGEIQQLIKDSERNQGTHRQFYERFEKIEKTQAVQDERYTNILKEMNKISVGIDEIKAKPGKKWDNLMNSILQWFVIALLVASNWFK